MTQHLKRGHHGARVTMLCPFRLPKGTAVHSSRIRPEEEEKEKKERKKETCSRKLLIPDSLVDATIGQASITRFKTRGEGRGGQGLRLGPGDKWSRFPAAETLINTSTLRSRPWLTAPVYPLRSNWRRVVLRGRRCHLLSRAVETSYLSLSQNDSSNLDRLTNELVK